MRTRMASFLFIILAASSAYAIDSRDELRESRDTSRTRPERSHTDTEILVKFSHTDRAVEVPTRGERVDDVVARYRGRVDVEYAEPNIILEMYATPNDPYFSYQWNMHTALGGIHAPTAWDTASGNGAIVAILDTGIAYENYTQSSLNRYYLAPDLAGTQFVPGYDFINNDSHPNDDQGHGTHVAGTIAQSTNNALGAAGVAYGARLMPVKILDSRGYGTASSLANGIRFAADNGAHIINLSLGSRTGSNTLRDALAYAFGKGATIVAATGNDGLGSLSYPAAYDEYVIAVGATRYDELRAPYSNYGPGIDVVAPGGDMNVDQNGDGYGDGVLQQTFSGQRNNWGYHFFQGTSMATPHVAGVAALLVSTGVTSPSEIRNRIQTSAKDLGAAGYDTVYGHGLVNAAAAMGSIPTPPPPSEWEPEPEPQPIASTTVFFADSFETGLGGWTQDSQRDWAHSSQRATDGSHSAEVDGSASNASITASIALPTTTNVRVSFDWLIEDGLDGGEFISFEASTDNGASWKEYARLRGNVDAEDVWHTRSFDFSAVPSLRIRFKGTMSSSAEDANVDNVRVSTI
jgi:serine protease